MYPRVAQFKTIQDFAARLAELGLSLPIDERVLSAEEGSPLARPLEVGGFRVGNRWAVQPMEGWDGLRDGSPGPLTLRRWRHFGESGAKLIWGGEAAAVVPEGRANPNQLIASPQHRAGLAELLTELRAAHRARYGTCDDLLVGLQLTHSGRYAQPDPDGPRPRIAYHHPLLDARKGIRADDDSVLLTDDDLERLIENYVVAAGVAREAGFAFVDIKACHGYLIHELLGARARPGRFGGDLAGRTLFLRSIVERVRSTYPDLMVGVRMSVFDTLPFATNDDGDGASPVAAALPYQHGFGVDPADPARIDLTEPIAVLRQLRGLGVALVNVSGGSPYYNPHVLRPAAFPPCDGYPPPEDPLIGVARHIEVTRQCKAALGELPVVGSGYTYLQEFLPHVAQAVLARGWVDFVGLGRMILSYPHFADDVLRGRPLARKQLCRTFSDCTTGPRSGVESGCYPLDPFYKGLPQAAVVKQCKLEQS